LRFRNSGCDVGSGARFSARVSAAKRSGMEWNWIERWEVVATRARISAFAKGTGSSNDKPLRDPVRRNVTRRNNSTTTSRRTRIDSSRTRRSSLRLPRDIPRKIALYMYVINSRFIRVTASNLSISAILSRAESAEDAKKYCQRDVRPSVYPISLYP
jgi:hypothetical protein